MGREAKITPEQIHAAADALEAEGASPTGSAVRVRLGNVGSMSTIYRSLQTRKPTPEPRPAEPLALSPVLQRALLDFTGIELAAVRTPLEKELAEQKKAVLDLVAECGRLADSIEEQDAELAKIVANKAVVEDRAKQLAADLAEAKEEAARERHAAEATRTELAKVGLRLEAVPRLESDLAATRASLAAEQQAAEATRTELAKAGLRLEVVPRLESDLAATRADLAAERQLRVDAERRADVLEAQKTDLEGRLGDAKKEFQRASEQLETVRARAEKLADELADARVKIEVNEARIEGQAQQIEVARKDADQARAAAKVAGENAAMLRGKLDEKPLMGAATGHKDGI